MKLAVGYPVTPDEETLGLFVNAVEKHRDAIEEVYFALPGEASGRAPAPADSPIGDILPHLSSMGLRLDLLFNGNCYGPGAASDALADHVRRTIDRARETCPVHIVTTTSPFVAEVLGRHAPDVERRASVNMRIGTIPAMEMQKDLFESFCFQRDYNRDLEQVQRVKTWCVRNDKNLCLLANSGCLAFCSGQTFHDNLVSHEKEMPSGSMNGSADFLTCRRFLKDPDHRAALLSATWIRPEDVEHYDGLADTMKLATRMHNSPDRVIRAYANRRHRGNLLDLLEPGHGDRVPGLWLDNSSFPPDWFQTTTTCRRQCETCSYCDSVFNKIKRSTTLTR